jgi:hypothetical protein
MTSERAGRISAGREDGAVKRGACGSHLAASVKAADVESPYPMKLILTLLVRDEADIVDANLAYHLNRGVDFVIATDNNSKDGTREILDEYRRMGYLHLIREPAEDYAQSAWVTRMARLAASEHGADWIIHGDADEFWWPRRGTLKDIFASIPERFGVLHAHRFDFIPRPAEDGFFAERMTVRVGFPDKIQVAHRPDPSAVVGQGNHRLDETALAPAPSLYAIDVLHFPLRSYEQFEGKVVTAGPSTGVKHWRNAYELHADGDLRANWDSLLRDDTTIDELIERQEPAPTNLWVGRASKRSLGRLARDHRLRDYLRELRRDQSGSEQERSLSPTGFSLSARDSGPPQPDPEVALRLEIAARELGELVKPWVVRSKEQARELKELRHEIATLRGELERWESGSAAPKAN